MKFNYVGTTRQRQQVSGTVEALDELDARNRLRNMQIRPTNLTSGAVNQALHFDLARLSFSKPIDLKGLVVFTRQFSSLVDSGIPIVQCLDILYQQESRKAFKAILGKLKSDIEGGSGLAESLGKHPRIFGDFFVRVIEAGEVSGTLDTSIRRVGLQLEKLGKLRSKVISAMMYPCITLVVSIVTMFFMLVKVIPGVAKLYADSSAKLPDLTVFVLGLSQWAQDNAPMIGIVVLLLVIGLPLLYSIEAVRWVWDPIVLRIPLFGTLIKKSTIATFSRTMSTLVSSGVPLLNAFDICKRLSSNYAIKAIIQSAANSVSEGKTIANGLAQHSLFPPMVVHMVNIGEMTGKLDELLGKVADIFDDEVDNTVSNLTGLIQPLLIIFVGGIVAFLLLAMYLPIFQLAEKVAG